MRPLSVLCLLLPALACTFSLNAQTDYFPEQMMVKVAALKLRSEPTIDKSNVLATLSKGDIVDVLGTHNRGEVVGVGGLYAPWYKVKNKAGVTGYAFGAYLSGMYNLHYEDELVESGLAPLNYYGVYRRDSFSDELRKIEVRTEKTYSEMYEAEVQLLKTNQKDTSKFIIGTVEKLREGYVGPLGIMDSPGWFFEGGLTPGVMIPISAGQAPDDTTFTETVFLAATGCAELKDSYISISGFKLQVIEILPENNRTQDLSAWFTCEAGLNPTVQLLWYGDIDRDRLPDAVIHDCPYEMGCRTSLFLSSKARPGELMRKVCEHFWEGD